MSNRYPISSSKTSSKPCICFVALNCYNLIANRQEIEHIGGAEVQQLLMARWLVEHGYDVSFVTLDHGQPANERIDGIRVFKAYDKKKGVPGIRFVYPRWTGIWSALHRADADIYYQRCAGAETGQTALWCRLNKRKFMFGAANDGDLLRNLPYLPNRREKYLFRLGLHLADKVITQTNNQRGILKDNFGIASTVLRNSGGAATASQRENSSNKRVLWVGRFIPLKRLEWLLDVAKSSPDFEFDVVGSGDLQSEYVSDLIRRANQLTNVHLHGRVPYPKMAEFYDRCDLVCSTSETEGFPNVYIEAWAAGIPVLTSFDPDGVIEKSGAGWVRNSVDEYIHILTEIASNNDIWMQAAAFARKIYDCSHRLSVNMPVFEKLLQESITHCRA